MSYSLSDSATNNAVSVAIIGNGIAGSSAARSLALTMPDHLGCITLYEIGRGPGGRAATRKTRSIPEFRVNHGAPYADISTDQGLDQLPSLGDAVQPYAGDRCVIDGSTGARSADAKIGDEALITGENGEMANIASSLLLDGDNGLLPPITTRYSTMVRGLSRNAGGNDQWSLSDKYGEEVGTADWLIVSGSGVAHPRWSATFGGEPPLVAAAAELGDSHLNESLETIAQQTAAPVITVLFYGTDDVADQWRRLGFSDALVKDHDILSKISIQPCDGGGCSVVLHSTIDYARDNAGVHGSSSSAARVGDASSDTTREEDLIDEMLSALGTIPGMPAFDKSRYAFGPLLHRWGNAFPEGEPLPQALSVCPDARVAFCGDYVGTSARMGSYESALLSGVNVAEAMHAQITQDAG